MQKEKKFQKRQENFKCAHCGKEVEGTGYTNHCPECFYSKHVDINPGDRANPCQGLMPPVALAYKNGEYILTHRCRLCGQEKKNKLSKEDNRDRLIALSADLAKTITML